MRLGNWRLFGPSLFSPSVLPLPELLVHILADSSSDHPFPLFAVPFTHQVIVVCVLVSDVGFDGKLGMLQKGMRLVLR